MGMTNKLLNCPVCSSTRLTARPFGYNFNEKWLGGMGCGDCGLIFIHPQPTAAEIKSLYSKEYFNSAYRCGHEGSYFSDETIEKLGDDTLLHRIKQYKPSGELLEIGCAGGVFLNAARGFGYNVRGVEFSDDAADFARKKFKLSVITGDLANANFPSESFDVIFMGDVLEHLPSPGDTMKLINRVMKKNGLLVILCPMQTNTLFSRFGFMTYGAIDKKSVVHLPPYHLFEYRPKSLSNLVNRFGFKVVAIEQFAVAPSELSLRGSFVQRFLKKAFQYPNYLVTKVSNKFGDRIELYSIKQSEVKS
jgi:SAM-dependent methyltransferase